MKHKIEKGNFAVCINNEGYPASLEVGKLYSLLPDKTAEKQGYVNVIDESGEAYGYSTNRFFVLDIPLELQQMLRNVATR